MPDRIVIFDTTLRDGEQAPGFSLDVADEAARWRARSTRSAWTSSRPASRSPRRPTAEAVRAGRARGAPAGHRGAGPLPPRRHRARRRGRSRRPSAARIHTFIATSDLHLARKLRMTREACLERGRRRPSAARGSYTDDVEFSAEDATRSDLDFLCRVVEAVIAAGATTINLPDTVGYATPDEIARVLHGRHRPRAERRPGDLQHALPRRPRPGRRQQPRGHPGRRRGRSSARSTASASAPATRRSRRS